jgi:hypothetical protein
MGLAPGNGIPSRDEVACALPHLPITPCQSDAIAHHVMAFPSVMGKGAGARASSSFDGMPLSCVHPMAMGSVSGSGIPSRDEVAYASLPLAYYALSVWCYRASRHGLGMKAGARASSSIVFGCPSLTSIPRLWGWCRDVASHHGTR